MNTTRKVGATLVAVALLGACGEDPKSKAPTTAAVPAPASAAVTSAAAPVATTAPAPATDPLAPAYDATLAQGIDFRKPGYPTFLSGVSGVAGHEPWGRWTEGSVARLRFKSPLPPSFTVSIEAGAIGPNVGKPIVVKAGKVEKTFTVAGGTVGPPPGIATFTLDFAGVEGADTIEIIPPAPVRPKDMSAKSDDTRLLGVGLVALKIQSRQGP